MRTQGSMFFVTFLTVIVSGVYALTNLKTYDFTIKLLIPPVYEIAYNQNKPLTLRDDLKIMTEMVTAHLNASEYLVQRKIRIAISLDAADDDLLMPLIQSKCPLGVTSLFDDLNTINMHDAANSYIVFTPCMAPAYADVFASAGVNVPLLDDMKSVECSRRISLFFESNFGQLLPVFASALVRAIGGPINTEVIGTEIPRGDKGILRSISISDEIRNRLFESNCFNNASGIRAPMGPAN